MLIPSWSHSRIAEFEKCKYRTYLMQVEKVQEPERPLPPGKSEHANDRGSRVHDECEKFVRCDGAMPYEATKFRAEFDAMQRLYQAGKVSLEGEWGMNRAWEPVPWRGEWVLLEDAKIKGLKKVQVLPDYAKPGVMISYKGDTYEWVAPWLRLKLDALVHLSKYEAIAIDYKTGKKFGNELKHAEQLQLYQLVTLLRYPELEKVTTELWYLDVDDLTTSTFTREQGLRFMRSWDMRGNKLTTCTEFPPNPNIHSCRYCGFGPWGTGHCAVGKK